MSRIRFGILGGDFRYKILSELLQKDGYCVNTYANGYCQDTVEGIEGLTEASDVIIAPIPCSKDGKQVFLPDREGVGLNELASCMDRAGNRVLIGGVMGEAVRSAAAGYEIRVYDFFDLEEVAVSNAIPTAEGAIQTAMQESERTVFGSRALVLGYGRCGKILANMLKGIGARVGVTYRKEADRAYITAYGYDPIPFKELVSYIGEFNFIFNTIPAPVLDREVLKKLSRDTLLIDLAQAPGGTDFSYARYLNIKALYCPGLPGRVAPYTAACVLRDAVINIALSNIR